MKKVSTFFKALGTICVTVGSLFNFLHWDHGRELLIGSILFLTGYMVVKLILREAKGTYNLVQIAGGALLVGSAVLSMLNYPYSFFYLVLGSAFLCGAYFVFREGE